MSALYRETPCGHCGEPGRAQESCPDCRRIVCAKCVGPERCPTPVPRVHELGSGRRIVTLERTGKAALYATRKGQLRTFDLERGKRAHFPAAASVAHQRLASGDRWPWVSLLEGGHAVARLLLGRGRAKLTLRHRGETEELLTNFPDPHQHKLRLLTAADESMLFAAAHDAKGRASLRCYGVVGAPRPQCSIALNATLQHTALLDGGLMALTTGRELHVYRLSDGDLLARSRRDVRWLGAVERELILVEKAQVKYAFFSREQNLVPDRQWRVKLLEPTMSSAPGDASLAPDGAMLALLGKTRRRLLLVDIEQQEIAGVLGFEADIDLMRFVEGERLLVALANGKLIEFWRRSLLTV